ncbi:MAG: DoxX family protein [Actinomycetota bacterium]
MDVGVLVIRLAVGLIIAAHGTQKLFGWFDGPGIGGTAGMLESMGFTPARPFAILTGTSEMMGGLALASGFFTPLAVAMIVGTMTVAIVKVHLPKGFFNAKGGFEFPLLIALGALGVGLSGPGFDSIDRLIGVALPYPTAGILALIVGLGMGLGVATLSSLAVGRHKFKSLNA